jgi:hypothetical protein
MARDFLTVATNGVSVERLFNSSRDICHYRRSRLYPDTIEAIMLQMCTDRFTINEEYQQILDEVDPDSIVFAHKEEDDDTTEAPLYISDNEDIDDVDEDPEDGLLPDPTHTTRTVEETRSLRHHQRRPGQYKE